MVGLGTRLVVHRANNENYWLHVPIYARVCVVPVVLRIGSKAVVQCSLSISQATQFMGEGFGAEAALC